MKKILFYLLALAAGVVSCSDDAIEVPEVVVVNLTSTQCGFDSVKVVGFLKMEDVDPYYYDDMVNYPCTGWEVDVEPRLGFIVFTSMCGICEAPAVGDTVLRWGYAQGHDIVFKVGTVVGSHFDGGVDHIVAYGSQHSPHPVYPIVYTMAVCNPELWGADAYRDRVIWLLTNDGWAYDESTELFTTTDNTSRHYEVADGVELDVTFRTGVIQDFVD